MAGLTADLVCGLNSFGSRLDELHHVIRVRDHRHVVGRDFDDGCTHAISEQTLSIGRDRLVAIGDQEPGRVLFPCGDAHHVLEGGRR